MLASHRRRLVQACISALVHQQPQCWRASSVLRRFASQAKPATSATALRRCRHGLATRAQEVQHLDEGLSRTAVGAEDLRAQRMVRLRWDTGEDTHYPYMWMRDACRCPQCFHPVSLNRTLHLQDFNLDVAPQKVEFNQLKNEVTVQWDDGHDSTYSSEFLWDRRFTEEGQALRKNHIARRPALWGKEMQGNIPEFDFEQALEDDNVLYDWMVALEEYGITILKNTPKKLGQLERLANKVSFIQVTHYGPYWQLRTRSNPNNIAYTPDQISLHSDLGYKIYPPGVQFFHFIVQARMQGGQNQFVDGFKAIQDLWQEDPETFDLLCNTPIDFRDEGADLYGKFNRLAAHPTITLDREGDPVRLVTSYFGRDSHLRVPLEDVEKTMRALHKLNSIFYRESNIIELKPVPGDMINFYNHRVLHGRRAYKVEPGEERHAEGGYIDMDEIRSRRRVIQEQLGIRP